MWPTILVFTCWLLQRGETIGKKTHQAAPLRCVQCSSGTGTNVSHCVTVLPAPKPCGPGLTHCITVAEYRNLGVRAREVLMEVTRTCIGADLGDSCDTGRTSNGIMKKLCTFTCSTDGCNVAGRPARLNLLHVGVALALVLSRQI